MNRMDSIIKITSDARFRLARTLMTSGGGGGGGGTINSNSSSSDSLEGAIDIFASLLEECRNRHGETSLIAALCYYEYGNALFRAVVRRKPSLDIEEEKKNDHDDCDGEKKPAAKLPPGASAVARKRSLDDDNTKETDTALSNKNTKTENSDEGVDNDDDDEDDIALALEMLSTSFSIFDYWHSTTKTSAPDEEEKLQYSLSQIPRILSAIGDIYSYSEKFGNAVDAYCRALPYCENACKERQEKAKGGESLSKEDLTCQRLLVETYALIAEALLAYQEGEDVVCVDDQGEEEDALETKAAAKKTKSDKNKEGKVLVAAKDRIDFAQSHYETAREKLQDLGKCVYLVQYDTRYFPPFLQTTNSVAQHARNVSVSISNGQDGSSTN